MQLRAFNKQHDVLRTGLADNNDTLRLASIREGTTTRYANNIYSEIETRRHHEAFVCVKGGQRCDPRIACFGSETHDATMPSKWLILRLAAWEL